MSTESKQDVLRKLGFGTHFNRAEKRKLNVEKKLPFSNVETSAAHTSATQALVATKRNKIKSNDDTKDKGTIQILQDRQIGVQTNEVAETITRKRRQKKKKTKTVTTNDRQEKLNELRKAHKIYTWGSDIPEPCTSFHQMDERYGVPEQLKTNMEQLGFLTPTSVQMQSIPLLMEKRELLVSAPTGSGKTLAFSLPIICNLRKEKDPVFGMEKPTGIQAVIIEPTRELAKQTYNEILRLCNGMKLRVQYLRKLKADHKPKKCDILISTPNRLVFELKDDRIHLHSVRWLIIDESDKLFETGERGFRNQLGKIYKACDGDRVRRALFSATFSYEVEDWCKNSLDNLALVCIGARNSAVESIDQQLMFVGSEQGKLVAIRRLLADGLKPPILIFVQSKDRAKQAYQAIIDEKLPIKTAVIHSDMNQNKRDEAMAQFRSGDVWCLISTELLGRGIDFKGINVVINFDFPLSAISYIHRIGRTGRAGRSGKAVTFFTEKDKPLLRSIATLITQSGCPVPDYMLTLKKSKRQLRKKLQQKAPKRSRLATNESVKRHKIRRKKKKSQSE